MRVDGFITDIYSSNKHDVIKFKSLFEKISVSAHTQCGLYYEIYYKYVLDGLLNYMDHLEENEKVVFSVYAESEGFKLDAQSYDDALNEFNACLAEIKAERE